MWADSQTDRLTERRRDRLRDSEETEIMKLIVTFSSFMNALKNASRVYIVTRLDDKNKG
jgi:hypothetical protein